LEGVRKGPIGLELRSSDGAGCDSAENVLSMVDGLAPLPPLGLGPYGFQDDRPDEKPLEGVYAEIEDVGVKLIADSAGS
jgi:hypothetical protein